MLSIIQGRYVNLNKHFGRVLFQSNDLNEYKCLMKITKTTKTCLFNKKAQVEIPTVLYLTHDCTHYKHVQQLI